LNPDVRKRLDYLEENQVEEVFRQQIVMNSTKEAFREGVISDTFVLVEQNRLRKSFVRIYIGMLLKMLLPF
jgi:hypothetical protein